MTNNLNTVEGALQEVIDRLETNLTLRGVDGAEFNPSEGILGLTDMIMNIEPSVNIDLDITCTLTTSESIIEYGESILLTATLLASYDDTSGGDVDMKTGEITGATIQFKNGNTIIGTGVTDNNGVATLTYTPTAEAILNLTAVFNGTVNFQRAVSTSVPVTVTGTLELTSDKDILSYVDNDYATLTATLHSPDNANKNIAFEVRKQNPSASNTFLVTEDNYNVFVDNPVSLDSDNIDIDFSNINGFAGMTFQTSDVVLMLDYNGSNNTLIVSEFDRNNNYFTLSLNVDSISIDNENHLLKYTGGSESLQNIYDTIVDSSVEQNETISVSSEDSLIELLSGVTNSSGVATGTYYAKGEGDIYIKATCGLLTQTYSIIDLWKYTSNGNGLNGTFNLTDDYITNMHSDTGLTSFIFPSEFEINYKAYIPISSYGDVPYNNLWNIGSDENNGLLIGLESTSSRLRIYDRVGGSNTAQQTFNNAYSRDTWFDVSIKYQSGSWSVTVGNNTISYNKTFTPTFMHLFDNYINPRLKDFKIKPL